MSPLELIHSIPSLRCCSSPLPLSLAILRVSGFFPIENPESAMEGEFQDFEMIQSVGSTAEDHPRSMEEIDDGTQGVIRFDYFSLENNNNVCPGDVADEDSENGSVGSGSPSWIEPGSDPPYGKKHPCEFWSDSSSDRSEDRKLVEFGVNNDLGLEYSGISDVGMFDLTKYSGSLVRDRHLRKYWLHSSGGKLDSGIAAEEIDDLSCVNMGNEEEQSTVSGELVSGNDPQSYGLKPLANSGDGGKKNGLVWWKLPFELFKHCVFKANPVWSFSVAAAVVGFVMLGRRLHKMMKKKSRRLQMKVSLDDKVARLVSHAARLDKVVPAVKRVPIIRPALPAMAVSHLPVVTLR
ncbi:PREDICTED: uncharacterized protein LOC104821626 isoform X2 [Tarenaya hassleriana]|uniref:uncharacterized protein LOC104821626 isoform X2 n=1 Tax=Tarenaya hassleriana TaxID=28532 RepID=UPI0008FD02CE|nr:PREDICTED: uncharacterized protein LOC104821626 isoform X2 [Tarenaya hassleriana]